MLRERRAENPSAMTLEGTRTFLVGERRIAVIDPGPDLPSHLDAVAGLTGSGVVVAILLTHEHPDHAGGAEALADRVRAPVRSLARGTLQDGQAIATDAGDVVALHTPGHTPDHACFHWTAERAIFCGDLMMGGLDTALVGLPEGNLRDYLESLGRVRTLGPAVIHPAHGPSFVDPAAAIDRYVRHRETRLARVQDALDAGASDEREILDAVYGDSLPPGLKDVALGAVRAYLEYLHRRHPVTGDAADPSDGRASRRTPGTGP